MVNYAAVYISIGTSILIKMGVSTEFQLSVLP